MFVQLPFSMILTCLELELEVIQVTKEDTRTRGQRLLGKEGGSVGSFNDDNGKTCNRIE